MPALRRASSRLVIQSSDGTTNPFSLRSCVSFNDVAGATRLNIARQRVLLGRFSPVVVVRLFSVSPTSLKKTFALALIASSSTSPNCRLGTIQTNASLVVDDRNEFLIAPPNECSNVARRPASASRIVPSAKTKSTKIPLSLRVAPAASRTAFEGSCRPRGSLRTSTNA